MLISLALASISYRTPDEMRVDAIGQVWELCIVENAQSPLSLLPNLKTKEVVDKAVEECGAFKTDLQQAYIRLVPQSLKHKGITGYGAALVNSVAFRAVEAFESEMLLRVTATVNRERRTR